MLLQQENHPPVTPLSARVQPLAGAEEAVDERQAALALQVGSALDPGIERKLKPNEDTVSIIRGVIPPASSKPFALFMVADGMARGRLTQKCKVPMITTLLARNDAPDRCSGPRADRRG